MIIENEKTPKYDGKSAPVKLIPKFSAPTAMQFDCNSANFPGNLAEVISWLGEAFCCLTDGEEVIIRGKKITRPSASDPDTIPLDSMTLIIIDDRSGSIIVAKSGDWITWYEDDGYGILSDAEVDSNYRISDLDEEEEENADG